MSSWVHSDAFLEAMGWAGTASAFLLFLAPVFTFWRIVRERDVSQFDVTPYLIALFQCGLWATYGMVTPGRVQPCVTNTIGAALELTWCLIYLAFTPKRASVALKILLMLALWVAVAFGDALGVPQLHWKSLVAEDTMETDLLGVLCAGMNILMFAAPLGIAHQVVKTRSVEHMPLSVSLAAFICSLCWFTYAILKNDMWILIPNVCGVVLTSIQLIIYATYCRGSGEVSDAKGAQPSAPSPKLASVDPSESPEKYASNSVSDA